MSLPLASVSFVMKIAITIWVLSAILIILLVLVQKGRGGGLGSAFGGAGASLLGTKTGDFLTWVTIGLVAVWLILSVVSAKWFKPKEMDILRSEAPIAAPAASETAELVPEVEKTTEVNLPTE